MTVIECNPAIKAFVTETLGCGCPESVFERIDYDARLVMAGLDRPLQRLLIGNRLLIYILESGDVSELQQVLPVLLAAGKADRDMHGYNRLRVVVATEQPDLVRGEVDRLLPCLPDLDDRAHVHVVPGRCCVAGS